MSRLSPQGNKPVGRAGKTGICPFDSLSDGEELKRPRIWRRRQGPEERAKDGRTPRFARLAPRPGSGLLPLDHGCSRANSPSERPPEKAAGLGQTTAQACATGLLSHALARVVPSGLRKGLSSIELQRALRVGNCLCAQPQAVYHDRGRVLIGNSGSCRGRNEGVHHGYGRWLS